MNQDTILKVEELKKKHGFIGLEICNAEDGSFECHALSFQSPACGNSETPLPNAYFGLGATEIEALKDLEEKIEKDLENDESGKGSK